MAGRRHGVRFAHNQGTSSGGCRVNRIGSFVRSLLQARKVGRSVHTFAGALLSTLLATAGLRLGLTATAPATLLGSIIYMVPGIALATGFVDLVSDHHMLAGAERILNAAFIFLILALSLVIADALL